MTAFARLTPFLCVLPLAGVLAGEPAVLVPTGLTVNGAVVTEVERKTFADGEAFRYVLPEGPRRIAGELTEWRLPEDATVWYSDGVNEYEGLYFEGKVRDFPVGKRLALPIAAKLADGTYRLITEANVIDWTDSAVVYRGAGRFAIDYYADAKGFDQEGAATSPWRVMLVAKDLQTLATSDIVRRLCPAPSPEVAAAAAKIRRPGRAIWHWIPDGAPKFAEQRTWYDRTKALGFEYYLVDEGWRNWRAEGRDQWSMLGEVVAYGNSIGVKTFIWVHSRELMNPEARRAYLKRVRDLGAVGIKIDFMPPPSYRTMKWYEETSRDTLAAGLMLDYHGAVKPTGRERTWPHEMAREGIRGHEWHVTRYHRVLPFEHDTILPFTRLVQGHADYTPMVFNPKELIHFTWARELAQGIVFSAPFLCFGDYPQNYLDNPAAELIRRLPAEYDETRVLPLSEIGRTVALAKRKGDAWFIAVENGAAPRELKVKLDFLAPGRTYALSGFGDPEEGLAGYTRTTRPVKKGDTLTIKVRTGGGYAAYLALTDAAAAEGADRAFEGVVTLQRPGDMYCFVTTTNGVSWRVEFDPKNPRPYPAGTAVRVEGRLEGEPYRHTWRLFGCRVARVDEAPHPLPAPRTMTCAELWAHPAESPLPRPDWYASRVAVEGRVANFNRNENETWLLLEDGPYHVQVKVLAPVTEPLPEDFELGARVRVKGVALYSALRDENRKIVGFDNVSVFPASFASVEILSHPPFWTPPRVTALIAGLVALLGGVLLWAVMLRRAVATAMRKLETVIREKVHERVAAEAARRERLRLAHDLHDGFQQLLAATSFRLLAAKNLVKGDGDRAAVAEQIALAAQSVEHTQAGLRTVLWSMTEESEGPSGIAGLFRYAAGRMPHWDGVVTFAFTGEEKPVTRQLAGSLLMILQEAVGNALRHGGADHVRVAVAFGARRLVMTVTDDGSGFEDASFDSSHLGLRSMRERAESLGGTFGITSAIGKGTEVKVEVPL